MSRVEIVSPLSAVPGCRVHCEEGRGRGAVSFFLLVPDEPAGALSKALEMLHDPRGPADLDHRLGQIAAASPKGTSFLVSLEEHIWIYPSPLAQIRLLKDSGIVESLNEPQVVRLSEGQRIEVADRGTGRSAVLSVSNPRNLGECAPAADGADDLADGFVAFADDRHIRAALQI